MSYKILENNAVDNTNIEGAAFNKFVAGKKSGIIEFANNCSLSATGNVLIISNGILLIGGVRVRITEPESFTISSAPVIDTRYQVIAQLINTDGENFDFSVFIQDILPLVQNDIVADAGVYQLELGRFTHTTTGEIDDVIRTADILTAGPKGDKGLDGLGSNPNLLINGDFAINQRGASSYVYTSAKIYGVDRWYLTVANVTASVSGTTLTLTSTNTSAGVMLSQDLENFAKYKSKTVTVSFNATRSAGSFAIQVSDGVDTTTSSYISATGTVTATHTVNASATKLTVSIMQDAVATTITPIYCKLELGSIATPFVPPLRAEELPKCQRYGIPIRLHGGANYATSTTSILCGIPLPTTLRTSPTITVSTQPTVGGNGSTYTATNALVGNIFANVVTLLIITSGLTENEIYALQGGMAFLDAEIY